MVSEANLSQVKTLYQWCSFFLFSWHFYLEKAVIMQGKITWWSMLLIKKKWSDSIDSFFSTLLCIYNIATLTLFFFINILFWLVDDFTLQFYAKQKTPQEYKGQNLGCREEFKSRGRGTRREALLGRDKIEWYMHWGYPDQSPGVRPISPSP